MTFLWIPSHWNTEFPFEFEIVRISRETEQSNAPMTGEVEQLLQSTQSTPLAKQMALLVKALAGIASRNGPMRTFLVWSPAACQAKYGLPAAQQFHQN